MSSAGVAEAERALAQNVAEAERALAQTRSELEFALTQLRVSARHATDLRRRAALCSAQIRAGAQRREGTLLAGALAVGFAAGGGPSGLLRAPFAVLRAALGRRPRSATLRREMREDRYTKQLGRSLAALASADRHMRSRRSRLWQAVRPTPRKLVMLTSAGVGAFRALADESTTRKAQAQARRALAALTSEIGKRIDAV
jgi:hypothetical protein